MLNWLKQNAIDNLVVVGFLLAITGFFIISSDSDNVQAANYTRLDTDWTAGTLIPKYYASFKLPIISGTAFDDVGSWLPDMAKVANIKVNQSGKWSEVLGGAGLSEDDIVLIPEGVEVTYDENSNQAFKAVAVKGSLIFDPTKNTKMTVDTIHVYVTGELDISPANRNVKSEVVFSGNINTTEDPEQFNLGLVASGGKIQIIGTEVASPFTAVVEAEDGSNTIMVENPSGWQVGDELYLASSLSNQNITDPDYEHTDQTEKVSIVSIFNDPLVPSETIITLNRPLEFNHDGYVTNVTRNVVLRSDTSSNNDRGHILFSGHTLATVSNASLIDLGRTTIDVIDSTEFGLTGNPTTIGSNQNNRHALQARYVQNAFFFKGNAIINPNRFGILNNKGTGIISGNSVVGATGSAIATASGVETGLIVNNLVVGTKEAVSESEVDDRFTESEGDDIGADGSAFWFRGPLLKVESNIATGYLPGGSYVYNTDPDFITDNEVPNIDGVEDILKGRNIDIDTTKVQVYGSFNNNKAEGLLGAGLYLKNRQTTDGDNITNLNIKNLATDADGIKTLSSTVVNLENVTLTGANINGSGIGVVASGNTPTKINVKNSRIENFAFGYEAPTLGGNLEAVTFDNKVDIDVKPRPGSMSLALTGVRFTNTGRDNIKLYQALGAGKTIFAYNYNQTGRNYRIYSSQDNVPSTAVALVGLTNGLADNLDATDPGSGGDALVTNVSSDGLTVSWEAVDGATAYKIFVAAEPSHLAIPAKRKEITTVSAATLTYRIQKLSANTDIFIRVEAVGGNKFYQAYTKTKGGQSAVLAGPMKSVHLYAPDVLMIVMEDKRVQSFSARDNWLDKGVDRIIGYTGPTWQNGPWVIRRNDGSTIPVSNVYRESVPMGHFYDQFSPIGKVTQNMDNLLDVENRIFIKLSESIGSDEILDVDGPNDYNVIIPFSDKYLETPVIQLNQVGYNPRATRRYAYISGWMGDGGGLSLNNFPANANVLTDSVNGLVEKVETVSNIPVVLRSSNDVEAGTPVKEVSLASVPANDTSYYRVQLPGVGVSYKTMVSELATLKAFYVTARGLFLNRWGRDLDCQYTDWCDRPQDHPIVYQAEKSCDGLPCEGMFPRQGVPVPPGSLPQTTPPTDTPRSLVGGHHDAGDFDIRKFHYQVGRDLLRAYELNSDAFKDNQLNIPESGNGIPDLLDEILWSLAAWEQLQEANGGVRSGVESYGHPPLSYSDVDNFPYWTFSIDPYHTLRVAGLFAQTSRLVAPFNNQKALELRQRAVDAYDYAIGQGINHTLGGPIMYASSELYRLTGEARYKTMFESVWLFMMENPNGNPLPLPSFTNSEYWTAAWYASQKQPLMFDYALGYLGSDGANNGYKQKAINSFKGQTVATIARIENGSAHRSGRKVGGAITWGGATAVNKYTKDIDASMQLGGISSADRQADFNILSLISDYVLGANPMGMSWVTGLGSKSPTNILWGDSVTFMRLENMPTMPGIPVYGVGDLGGGTYYDYGKNVTYPAFETRPQLRKYADVRTFIQNNEFTVNETHSPIVKLFGILLGSNVDVPTSWKPGESNHKNPLPLSYGYTYDGGDGGEAPPPPPPPPPPPDEDPVPPTTPPSGNYDGTFGMIQNFQSNNVGMYSPSYIWYHTWGRDPNDPTIGRASSTLDIIQSGSNKYLRMSVSDSMRDTVTSFDMPNSLGDFKSVLNAVRLPLGVADILSPRADTLRAKFKIEQGTSGNVGLTFGSPVSQLGNSDVLLKVKYLSTSDNDDCTPLSDGWVQCDFDLNSDLIRNTRRANYSGGNSGALGTIRNLEGEEIIHYTRWVQEPTALYVIPYNPGNNTKIFSGNMVVLMDDVEVINSGKGKTFSIFTNPTFVKMIDDFEDDIASAFTVNFNWLTTQQKVPVLSFDPKSSTGENSLLITSKTGEELAWTGVPAHDVGIPNANANAVSFEMRVEGSDSRFSNHVIDFIALATPNGGPFSWTGLSGSNGYTYQLSKASTTNKNFAVYHSRRMIPNNQWVTVSIPFVDFVTAYGSGTMVDHHRGQKPLSADEISVVGLQTSYRQVMATSSIYIDSIRYINVPGTDAELRSFWQPYVDGEYITSTNLRSNLASLDVRSQVGNVIQSILGNIKEIILDFLSKIMNFFKDLFASDVALLSQ
jgi:endoglucanase